MPIIDNQPGQVPYMENLYAWISVDENQFEGIIAGTNPPLPFISTELEVLKAWEPYVQDIATKAGKKCRLVKFGCREIVTELTPGA